MDARTHGRNEARQEQLDRVFSALADRTRRAMLDRLAAGPARVTELAAPFAMSLPAVSRHLKLLEEARLVERRVDGRVHHCSLSRDALQDVEGWLQQYRSFWQGSLKSLARYMESGRGKPQRALKSHHRKGRHDR
jgi:DNA-binding transcriptional ArsR family regulator